MTCDYSQCKLFLYDHLNVKTRTGLKGITQLILSHICCPGEFIEIKLLDFLRQSK